MILMYNLNKVFSHLMEGLYIDPKGLIALTDTKKEKNDRVILYPITNGTSLDTLIIHYLLHLKTSYRGVLVH